MSERASGNVVRSVRMRLEQGIQIELVEGPKTKKKKMPSQLKSKRQHPVQVFLGDFISSIDKKDTQVRLSRQQELASGVGTV